MNIYCGSASAYSPQLGEMASSAFAVIVEEENINNVFIRAEKVAHDLYPTGEGWTYHNVNIARLREDFMAMDSDSIVIWDKGVSDFD